MTIENRTKWDTNDLRKLFGRCIQEVRRIEGKGRNKGLQVLVKNTSRHRDISGRAYIGYYKMTITIGNEADLRGEGMKDRLARVFIHEYYHNLGYRSQDYRSYTNDWTKNTPREFVKDYSIKEKVIKVKPVRDLQMERYQKVLRFVKLYETKAKRTNSLLKKWKQKQGYYERTLVASGKIVEDN